MAVAEVEAGTSGSVIGGRESAKASVATGKEGIRSEFNRWWTQSGVVTWLLLLRKFMLGRHQNKNKEELKRHWENC